jgi:hypothetical protein
MKKWKGGRKVDNEDGWMKKGKEEVGYLMLMDGYMDEELCPADEKRAPPSSACLKVFIHQRWLLPSLSPAIDIHNALRVRTSRIPPLNAFIFVLHLRYSSSSSISQQFHFAQQLTSCAAAAVVCLVEYSRRQ